MEPTLNTTPCTPEDFAAFSVEYAEWNAAVEASVPAEEPVDSFLDEQAEGYPIEDDCPMDGDAESALASAGFGTDEDYEHNDAWMDEEYNGMYEGEY